MRNPTAASLLVLSSLLLLPTLGSAAGHYRQQARQSEPWYVTLMLGWHDWSDAGDLKAVSPFTGGDFDSGGFNLEFSLHGPAPWSESGRLMWGITTGVMGNDSEVKGRFTFDDLQLGMVYIAPSMKFKLSDSRSQRIYLDFGVGYYAASIDEYSSYCYYYCYSTEYWDDNSIGGFVGLSADFDVGRPGGGFLNVGFKAHDVNFSTPIEIGATEDLGGPIVQFQIGMGFGGY